MTRLTIDSSTTVSQLHAFLNTEGATDTSRLRAKVTGKDENGNKTYSLYVSNKASSLKDGLSFFKANSRNKAAEVAIHRVFRNVDKTTGSTRLLNDIRTSTTFDGKHALRGDVVKRAAEGAMLIEARIGAMGNPELLNATNKRTVDGLAPQKLPGEFTLKPSDVMQIAEHALSGGATPAAVSHLAGVITDALEAAGATPEQMQSLALTAGTHVKQAVREAVTESFSRRWAELPETFGQLLDAGFNKAACDVLGTRQAGSAELHGQDRPVIEIGGARYEPTEQVGAGGYGTIFLYSNAEDPNDKIVLKLFNPPPPRPGEDPLGPQANVISEVRNHQQAQGLGSPNVVRLEHAIRLDNGEIAAVLEKVPHGTATKLTETLHREVGTADNPGPVSKADATRIALTLIRDFLTGLSAIHEQGIVHHDFKPENCMIGENGQGKIIDFGTSSARARVKQSEVGVDTPHYLSPEMHRTHVKREVDASAEMRQRVSDMRSGMDELVNEIVTAQAEQNLPGEIEKQKSSEAQDTPAELRQGLIKDESDRIWSGIGKKIETLAQQEIARSMAPTIDKSTDVWGMGLTALELLTGQGILRDEGSLGRLRDGIANWATGPDGGVSDRKAIGGDPKPVGERKVPTDGSALEHLAPSTGDAQLDDFLNKLLAPDPQKRISAEDALNHPVFEDADIGSKRIRDLAVKLADNREPEAAAI